MLTRPTLLLDEDRCRANIRRMAEKAQRHGLIFRPHFKTHQSLAIGRWFREAGVDRITVSSVSMAAYFAPEWDDITIAFPLNVRELDAINELAGRIKLNLCIENEAVFESLAQRLTAPVGVFLKIDVGYHRTGLDPTATARMDGLLDRIAGNELLSFRGFLGHAGHTYQCRSAADIRRVHAESREVMVALKKHFAARYPDAIISLGDTPGCSVAEDFAGIDEMRPGNFVFYDLTQHRIGSNRLEDIAVAMACPIVAKHPDRSEVVVYGGGVHFSKDRLEDEPEGTVFGRVVEKAGTGWGSVVPGAYVRSLSQEHGILVVPPERLDDYAVGDYLLVLPVHSCMAADAMGVYRTLRGTPVPRRH